LDASESRNLAANALGRARLSEKLRWRLNRLRCMTPFEVAHRVLRALQARAERRALGRPRAVPAPEVLRQGKPWIHAQPAGVSAARYVAAAERIADGRMDVFALRDADLGLPPRWNRDPKTGIEAPLAFGKTLDYRDQDRVGDIKYLWEPNRHLQLVTLAQAYALTGRRKHLDALLEQLDSWFLACPEGAGPNWSSALEAAIRLINWSLAWQLVAARGAIEPDFRVRWLESVYRHCRFIRHWFSAHSSANNHLIGEAAGLYIASLTWPCWKESTEWNAASRRILEREALAQNAADGVNREQALWYQQFVLDFLLYAMLAGQANGQPFPAAYRARLEAMLDFIASTMDAGGHVPMLGDADDGLVAKLEPGPHSPFRSALAAGALVFGRGDFKRKARELDERARWLFGDAADAGFASLDTNHCLPPRQAFPEGGYYVLGCDFETPREIRAVVDAGPLGYTRIAAHGHADALSFTLSVGGHELLVDPGTCAYHTQERWRAYFKGTGAHNTVRIDGCDQSQSGGNFMWLRHARAGCSLWLSSAERDSFEGWHDGYSRLEDPVKHRRLVELDKRARRLRIEDSLEMASEHEIELFFHCAEDCTVSPVAGGYRIEREGAAIELILPEGPSEVLRGSLAPIGGWVSRAFDRRLPSSTIVWRTRQFAPSVLRSEIRVVA